MVILLTCFQYVSSHSSMSSVPALYEARQLRLCAALMSKWRVEEGVSSNEEVNNSIIK
jgi:hypothetical protein